MNRFIDITACLFQPPGWNPSADELVFRPNERLEFSIGDIEEYGKVSEKVTGYNPKKIQTMNKENDIAEGSISCRGTQNSSETLAGRILVKTPIVGKEAKDRSGNISKNTPAKPRSNPAIGLPYIVINQMKPEDDEYTLIYFHANSEDIFRCLKMCRMLAEYLRVVCCDQARIIIPEYRGYSQLQAYDSDMDLIKTDMRFFVKELSKRGLLNISKTILFVGGCYSRVGVLAPMWQVIWFQDLISILVFSFVDFKV